MSQQSELLRRLRNLPTERRDEFLAQLDQATRATGGARSAPLSFRQEQLWLFDRVAPSSTAYGLGFAVVLSGPLDPAVLSAAIGDVLERHTVLRSGFPLEAETGTQVVRPAPVVRLEAEPCDPADAGRQAARIVREELRAGFDLNIGPMVRFRLLRLDHDRHLLVLVSHYLAMDPRSAGVLTADLAAAYLARADGKEPATGAAAPQFGEYASWQRAWSQSPEAQESAHAWQRALAGWENTELPTDLPRPRVLALDSGLVRRSLPAETVGRVRALAAAMDVPPDEVLLAAYFALVARHTATDDLIIGVPHEVTGPFPADELVGDVGNLLPVRIEVKRSEPFETLVRTVHERCAEARRHGTLPFKLLLDGLHLEPDPGRLPLVQLGFESRPALPEAVAAGDLRLTWERVDTGIGTFELALEADLSGPQPAVAIRYATALYREETASRLAHRYLALLEGGCAAPGTVVSRLPFADQRERAAIRWEWNADLGTYPSGCLHEAFSRVAAERGEAVALTSRDGRTTYAELDAWSNRIAHGLLRRGVAPGDRVPILMERGRGMVAAVLGVLKAGACYVPIDLSQPAERVATIAGDSGAALALASAAGARLLGGTTEIMDPADVDDLPGGDPGVSVPPQSLAYVIYTSGSTGRPKGVLIEHRNVVNFARTVREMFRLGPDDHVLQFASCGFDVSVFEIFGALLSGARLYVVDDQERASLEAVDAVLSDQRITVIDLPPAIMDLLEPERYPDLRVAFVGGEAFTGELTTRWARGRDFYNGYGPTETTVTVVAKKCEGHWAESPPIGRAMAGHRAYVLDPELGLQPPGAVGELAIAGLGVGRGYLGAPGQTAERFRPDPYGPPGSRMYLTGDLAAWRDDGELVFLGRADRQVKVRGVRIELGEVEAALQAVEGVARAVADVAVDPGRGTLLVAYVVAASGVDLQMDAVRAALGARLPATMIPNVLVPLEEVPLTQSGKVDRRALPAVEFAAVDESPDDDAENATPTERRVRAEVFMPLLGARIGLHGNFFAAGGTSLQAIRISARVKAVFDVEVSIADFFADPTAAGLAALVDAAVARDEARQDALAEALALVEGRSDEEIAALARRLDAGGTEGDRG